MADNIQIEIVTTERALVSDTAQEVLLPGENGYLGVLPGHAPLVSLLSVGTLAYRNMKGEVQRLAVDWGFAEVLPDKVTVLTRSAERASEIDIPRAEQAKAKAEEALKTAGPEDDVAKQMYELARAQNRLEVAKISHDLANLLP